LRQQQDLDKEVLDLFQKMLVEVASLMGLRGHAPRHKAHRQRLIGRDLDLPTTEQTCAVAIQQERKEQFRRIGRRSCRRIASVELTEIQLRHHVDNESDQMIGRQCLAQSDCQIEYGFVICGLKFSRHSASLPPSQLLIRVGRVFRQAASNWDDRKVALALGLNLEDGVILADLGYHGDATTPSGSEWPQATTPPQAPRQLDDFISAEG